MPGEQASRHESQHNPDSRLGVTLRHYLEVLRKKILRPKIQFAEGHAYELRELLRGKNKIEPMLLLKRAHKAGKLDQVTDIMGQESINNFNVTHWLGDFVKEMENLTESLTTESAAGAIALMEVYEQSVTKAKVNVETMTLFIDALNALDTSMISKGKPSVISDFMKGKMAEVTQYTGLIQSTLAEHGQDWHARYKESRKKVGQFLNG